ncbi:hypothetical protein GWI33_016311 [Rhynchophorus ferrugineus]|uniref:Mos1 transposase HTH domain-containing protein n=1 Tax=Rhynchophorus ferrugineus TaxID=354439 RepID=A0A834I1T1_RHYFE|nr:hypothetical protein GWI33_016311 [Rhynchophorus ferrugineus]
MDKKEFRILIKYGFLKGKNTVEAETWLDAEFPDTIAGKSTIKDWYAKFRRSDMITEDGSLVPRNNLPKSFNEYCSFEQTVLSNRKDLNDLLAQKASGLESESTSVNAMPLNKQNPFN